MWELKSPDRVKLIIGILAADKRCLEAATEALGEKFGAFDFSSDVWPFTQTDYYREQTGTNILRQFVSIERTISPGRLAKMKHKTNKIEQVLAEELKVGLPRPVNLDPGIISPANLVLATTKNFAHRIYIGKKMFAEVTLTYENRMWKTFEYTFPDYRQECYFEFFDKVRNRLLEQLKSRR